MSAYTRVFLFAAAIRASFFILIFSQFTSDQYWRLLDDTAHHINVLQAFAGNSSTLEDSLLLVGPGYGAILWLFSFIFGMSAWWHVCVQVVISSLNCALLCKLAALLTGETRTAKIAGYLQAISLTSISLSCALCTETWFVFFSLVGGIELIAACRTHTWKFVIMSSVALFAAAMIRPVGQFYPLLLIGGGAIAGYLSVNRTTRSDNRWKRTVITVGIASGVMISAWGVRNYLVNDIFTISETGTRAARAYWIASGAVNSTERVPIERVRTAWQSELEQKYGPHPTPKMRHDFDAQIVRDSLFSRPLHFGSWYMRHAWSNLVSQSFMQRLQAPQLKPVWDFYSRTIGGIAGKLAVIFALIGIVCLMLDRNWMSATVLGVAYAYFALITGASFWQGDRLSFPAQVIGAIAVAVALNTMTRFAITAMGRQIAREKA